MTNPTPNRAEVERFMPDYDSSMDPHFMGDWVRFTDYQALREREEAAERDRDEHKAVLRMTGEMLTAARRAEAAAWNDAIEAAGNLESIHGYSNAVPRHRIRALRRAAPTEDRS